MGYGAFYIIMSKDLQSICYATGISLSDDLGFSNAIQLDMVYGCRFNIFCFPMPT